jgi:hypothetical protein
MKVGIVVPYSWSYWGGVVARAARTRRLMSPVGHERPLSAVRRSAGTLVTASRKIARLIFEWPAVRSTK